MFLAHKNTAPIIDWGRIFMGKDNKLDS